MDYPKGFPDCYEVTGNLKTYVSRSWRKKRRSDNHRDRSPAVRNLFMAVGSFMIKDCLILQYWHVVNSPLQNSNSHGTF